MECPDIFVLKVSYYFGKLYYNPSKCYFSANDPPIVILTSFQIENRSFLQHFTLGLLPSKFNYTVSVSPQVQNKTFLQIDQNQNYDFVSDTMYNFTLSNTDCINIDYSPPFFTYGKYFKILLMQFMMILYFARYGMSNYGYNLSNKPGYVFH